MSELCLISRADRNVLPPVLQVTKKLYIVARPDDGHVTVSDMASDNAKGFAMTVSTDDVLSGDDLCVFCPERSDYSDECKACPIKQPVAVADDAGITIAEYIEKNGLHMDHPSVQYHLKDFFGTEDYLDKACGPAAVAILKAMDHAQAIARDPLVTNYNAGQKHWANSFPSLMKAIESPELDMAALSLYVDVFCRRCIHTLASDLSFRK